MAETVNDPIIELIQDHRNADMLFRRFEAAEDDSRADLLEDIIRELETHAAIEEEAIYPVMREVLADGESRVAEAIAEHQQVKDMISRLEGADASDPDVIAGVRDLARQVQHHASEEEDTLLVELREHVPPGKFTEIAEKATAARHAMQG